MPDSQPGQQNPSPSRPRIGLALGSGAARGWAHVGVLRALDELGIEIDVFAGCSVGAIVSASRLLGMDEQLLDWARRIGPVDAMGTFGFDLARGGLINPDRAFARFVGSDQPIEALAKPFAAVATDLATGREVWLGRGSTLDACRASSAVPMVLHASHYVRDGRDMWLIDGGASNPVPVNLARALGADRIIAVDLNAVTLALHRFNRPATTAVVPVPSAGDEPEEGPLAAAARFIDSTRRDLEQRFALAKAKSMAQPQFVETLFATIDIVQAQLAQARAHVDIADVRITPDLSCGSAVAFDRFEQFEEIGYEAAMRVRESLRTLTHPSTKTSASSPDPAAPIQDQREIS